jgi:hypothetical protein
MDPKSVAYLREENERLREQIREEEESHSRRRTEQRRQREEERREAQYTADTWSEAFQKNICRMIDELRGCMHDAQEYPGEASIQKMIDGWQRDIDANQAAAIIVSQKMKATDEAARNLLRAALAEAADQIDAEFPQNEISRFVREDDKHGLLYW